MNEKPIMSLDDFKWYLAYSPDHALMLLCQPETLHGERYPYALIIWDGNLSRYNGEITQTEEQETIELSGDNVFNLIERMQHKTITMYNSDKTV